MPRYQALKLAISKLADNEIEFDRIIIKEGDVVVSGIEHPEPYIREQQLVINLVSLDD